MKVAVLADDFTGACDVGTQFLSFGMDVIATNGSFTECDAEVIIKSSGTRNLNEKESYNIVKNEFKNIKKMGFDYFFKKIDSTLRGNIKSEIDAIVEEIEKTECVVIVIPFPKMGRIIVNGEHYLNGVRLIESEIAKDVVMPVKSGNLIEIFPNALHISLKDIRNNLAHEKIIREDNQIIVFDGETESDMIKIAELLKETGKDRIVAGSAGIANYLYKQNNSDENRVMIVSGSCSEVTLKQIKEFSKESCFKNFEVLDLTAKEIIEKNAKINYDIGDNDIVIKTIRDRSEINESYKLFKEKKMTISQGTKKISENFAKIVKEIIEEKCIRNLIILGGETTEYILKELKIDNLKLNFIIDIGISVAKSENMRYNLIIKPGNFGQERCIKKFYTVLKEKKL